MNKNILTGLVKYLQKRVNGVVFFSERKYFSRLVDVIGNRTSKKLLKNFENDSRKFKNSTFPGLLTEFLFLQVWPYSQMLVERQSVRSHRCHNFQSWNGFHFGSMRYVHPSLKTVKVKLFKFKKRKSNNQLNHFGSLSDRLKTKISPNVGRKLAKSDMYSIIVSHLKGLNFHRKKVSAKKKCEDTEHVDSNFYNRKAVPLLDNTARIKRGSTKFSLSLLSAITKSLISASHKKDVFSNVLFIDKKGAVLLNNLNLNSSKTEGKVHRNSKIKRLIPLLGSRRKQTFLEMGKLNCLKSKNNGLEMFTQCYSTQPTRHPNKIQKENYSSKTAPMNSKNVSATGKGYNNETSVKIGEARAKPGTVSSELKTIEKQRGCSLNQKEKDNMSEMYLKDMSSKLHRTIVEIVTEFPIIDREKRQLVVFDRANSNVKSQDVNEKMSAQKINDIDIQFSTMRNDQDEEVIKSINFGSLLFFEGISKMSIYKSKGLTEMLNTVSEAKPNVTDEMPNILTSNYFGRVFVHNGLLNISFPEVSVSTEKVEENRHKLNIEVVKSPYNEKTVLTQSPMNMSFFQIKNQTQGEVASRSIHNKKALDERVNLSLAKDDQEKTFKSRKTDHYEKVFILQLPSKISFCVHSPAPDDVDRIIANEGSNYGVDKASKDVLSSSEVDRTKINKNDLHFSSQEKEKSQKKIDKVSKDILFEKDFEFDDFRRSLSSHDDIQTTRTIEKDFNLSCQKVEESQNKVEAPKVIPFETNFEIGENSGLSLSNDGHGRISKNYLNNNEGEEKSKKKETSEISHHDRLMILLLPSRRLFNLNKLATEEVERKVANDRLNKETESSDTKQIHDTSRYFENVHNRYGLTKISLSMYDTDKSINSSGNTDASTKQKMSELSSEMNVKSDKEESISKSYSRRLLLPHNQTKMFLFNDTFYDETIEGSLKEESVHRPGMKYRNVGSSGTDPGYSSPHSTSDKIFFRKLSNKVPDGNTLGFRSRRDEEKLETRFISGQKTDTKSYLDGMDNASVQLNETLFDNFFIPQSSEIDGSDLKRPGYLVNIKKDFGEEISSLVKLFHFHGINNVSVVGPDVITPEHSVNFSDDHDSSFRRREPGGVNKNSESVILSSDFSNDSISNLHNMPSPGASFRGESAINDCEKEMKNNCEFLCMSDGDGRVSFFNDKAAEETLFSIFGGNELENIIGPNLFVSNDEKVCSFKSLEFELTSTSSPKNSGFTVSDDSECLPSSNRSDLECITFKTQDEVYSPVYPTNNLLVVDNIGAQSKNKIHYQSKTKESSEEPKKDEPGKKRETPETKIESNSTPSTISANKKDGNSSSKIMIGVNDINKCKNKLIYQENNYAPGYPRGDNTRQKKEISKTAKPKKDSSPPQPEAEHFKPQLARKMFSIENISLSGRSKIIKSFSDRQVLKVSPQIEQNVEAISKLRTKSNMELAKIGSFDQAVQNEKRISNLYNELPPGDVKNDVKSENNVEASGYVSSGQSYTDGGIQKYLDKLNVIKPKSEKVEGSVIQHTAKVKETHQKVTDEKNIFSVREENVEIKKVEIDSKKSNLMKKISFADTTIISPIHCKLKQSKDHIEKPSESVMIMSDTMRKKNTTDKGGITFNHQEEHIKKISELESGGDAMPPKTSSKPEPAVYAAQSKLDTRMGSRGANKSTNVYKSKSDKETKINKSILEKIKKSQLETEKSQLKGKIQESKLESIIRERNERILSILNEKVTMSGSETDFNAIQALESKRNDKLKTLLNELTQKLSMMQSKEVLAEKSSVNKVKTFDKMDERLFKTKEDETAKGHTEPREGKVTTAEGTSKQTFQHKIDQATKNIEKSGKSSKNAYEQGRIFGIIANKQDQQNQSVIVPIGNRKQNEHYQKPEDKLEEQTETIISDDSKYLDHLNKIITTIQSIENEACGKILVVQEKPQKNLLSLICNKTSEYEMGTKDNRGPENKRQIKEKIIDKKAEQVESKCGHISIYKYDKKSGAVCNSSQKPVYVQPGQKLENVENKPLKEKSERTFITSESNKLSISKSDQKMGTLGSKVGSVAMSDQKRETSGSTTLPLSLFHQRTGPVEGRMESIRKSDQKLETLSGMIRTAGKTDQKVGGVESKAMAVVKSNRMGEVTRAESTTMAKTDQKGRTFGSKSTELIRSEAKGKEIQHKPFIMATVGQQVEAMVKVDKQLEGLGNNGTAETKSDQNEEQLESRTMKMAKLYQKEVQLEDKTIKADQKEEQSESKPYSVAESDQKVEKVESKSAIKEKSNAAVFKNSFITLLPNRKVEASKPTSTAKSDRKGDEFQNKFITMVRSVRKPEAVERMPVAIANLNSKGETPEDKLTPMNKSERMGKAFEIKSITMTGSVGNVERKLSTTLITKSDLESRSVARLRAVRKVEAAESKSLSDRKGEPFEPKIETTTKVDLKVETESKPTSMVKLDQKTQEVECKVAPSTISDQKVETLESKCMVMAKSDKNGEGFKSGSIPMIRSDQRAEIVESKLISKAKSDQKVGTLERKLVSKAKSDQKMGTLESKLISKAKSDQKVGTLESKCMLMAKSDKNGEGFKSGSIPMIRSDQKAEIVESKLVSKAKSDQKVGTLESKLISETKSDQKVGTLESKLVSKAKSDQKVGTLESKLVSKAKSDQKMGTLESKSIGMAKSDRKGEGIKCKVIPMIKSEQKSEVVESKLSPKPKSEQKVTLLESQPKSVLKLDQAKETSASKPPQKSRADKNVTRKRSPMVKSDLNFRLAESTTSLITRSNQKKGKLESESHATVKADKMGTEPTQTDKIEQKIEKESKPVRLAQPEEIVERVESKLAIETISEQKMNAVWRPSMTISTKKVENVESKPTVITSEQTIKKVESKSSEKVKSEQKVESEPAIEANSEQKAERVESKPAIVNKSKQKAERVESKAAIVTKSEEKAERVKNEPSPVLKSEEKGDTLKSTTSSKVDPGNRKISEIKPIVENKETYIFNLERGKAFQVGSATTAKLIEKMELLTAMAGKTEGKLGEVESLHTTKTGPGEGSRSFESKPRAAAGSNEKVKTLATKPSPVLSSIHRWESLRNKDKPAQQSDKPEGKQIPDTNLNPKVEILESKFTIKGKSDEKVEILANEPIIMLKTDQKLANTTPLSTLYEKVEQSEAKPKPDNVSCSVKRLYTSEIHPQSGRKVEMLEVKVTPKNESPLDHILGKMERRSVNKLNQELKTLDSKPEVITKTELKPICKSCEEAESTENESLQKIMSDEIFGITDRSSIFMTNKDRITEAESKPISETKPILSRILETDTKTTSKADRETVESSVTSSRKSEQELDTALVGSVNVAKVVEKLEKNRTEVVGILKSDQKPVLLESKLQAETFDDDTAHLPTSSDSVYSKDKFGNQKLLNLNNENLAKLEDAFRKSKQQSENKETNTTADINIEKVKSGRNVFIRKDLSEAVRSFDLVSKAHNDSHGTSIELNLKCTVNRIETPDVSVKNFIPTGDNSSWKDIGQKPFIQSKPLNVVKAKENAKSPTTEMKSREDFGFTVTENSKTVQKMQQKLHPRPQINTDERKDPMEEAPLRRALPPELTNALELLRKKKNLEIKLNFERDILEKTGKSSDSPGKNIGIENWIPPSEKERAYQKLEVSNNKKVEEKRDLREVEGKPHLQLAKTDEKDSSQSEISVAVLLKSASKSDECPSAKKDEILIGPAVVDTSVAPSKAKNVMIDAQEALKQQLNETSVQGLKKKEVKIENRKASSQEEAVKSVPTTKKFITEKTLSNQKKEDTIVKDASKSKVVIMSEKKQKHPRDDLKRANVKLEATLRPDISHDMSKEEKEFKKQVALALGKEKSELDMIEEEIRNVKRSGIIKMDDIKSDKIQPDSKGIKPVPLTNNTTEDTKKLADLKNKLGNSLKVGSLTDNGAIPKNISISELLFKKKNSNVDLKMKQKLFDKPFPVLDNSLEPTGWSKVPQGNLYESKMAESSFKKKMKEIAIEQKKKDTHKVATEQEGTDDKITRSLNYSKIKKNDSVTENDQNLCQMSSDSTIIPSGSNVLTREMRKKLILPRTPPVLKEKIDKLNKMRGIRPKSKKLKSVVRNKFNPYNLTSPNSLHRKKDNEQVLSVPETRSLSRRRPSVNKLRYQHDKVYSLIPNPDLSKTNDKKRQPITLLPCTSPSTAVHKTTQEMVGTKKAKYIPRTITFEKCYNAIKEAEEKNVCNEQTGEMCEPRSEQESFQDDSYQCHPANKFIQINQISNSSCSSTPFDIAHTSKYDVQPYYQKECEGCQSLMKLPESTPSGEDKGPYSLMGNMMTSVKSTLQDLPSSFGRFSRDPRKVLGELSGIVSHSSITLKALQNKIELLQKKIKCDFQRSKMDSPCRQCVNVLDSRALSVTSSNVISKKKPCKVFYKVKKNLDNFHSKPFQKKEAKVNKGISLYPGRVAKIMPVDEEKETKPCPQLSYGDVLSKMYKSKTPPSRRRTM